MQQLGTSGNSRERLVSTSVRTLVSSKCLTVLLDNWFRIPRAASDRHFGIGRPSALSSRCVTYAAISSSPGRTSSL